MVLEPFRKSLRPVRLLLKVSEAGFSLYAVTETTYHRGWVQNGCTFGLILQNQTVKRVVKMGNGTTRHSFFLEENPFLFKNAIFKTWNRFIVFIKLISKS